jgi:hypothetical protein
MKALVGTSPKELTSMMTRKRREKARVLFILNLKGRPN